MRYFFKNVNVIVKGAVSRDFRTLFFFINQTHLAPDKQAKMFFFLIRFRGDICEKIDSAQANTVESKIEKLANTLQSWTPSSLTLRGFVLRAGNYNTV